LEGGEIFAPEVALGDVGAAGEEGEDRIRTKMGIRTGMGSAEELLLLGGGGCET
jgi:hypothetical protein